MTHPTFTVHPRHQALRRTGAILAVIGFILVLLGLLLAPAKASGYEFQGDCVGTATAGTCVLDEPEGKNPAVHGLVTYALVGSSLVYTITPDAPITEVQICMQTSGPFPDAANACAGSHGQHVLYTRSGSVYTVNLIDNGLQGAAPLFWTLHVVAGGRTLQVNGLFDPSVTTTTTSAPATTTASVATTTTPRPGTSTTVSGSTTTTGNGSTTTTTEASATTSTLVSGATTTTTQPVNVLGEQFARTGGRQFWLLSAGSALLLIGLTLLASARLLGPS
jgi:hypothetical protein